VQSNVQVVDDGEWFKERTNRHKSTGRDMIRFSGQTNNVVRSYKKYWKFLPCRNTGWFNDVDKKTSRRILVRL
jgi:hypothetical protein